MPNLIRYRRFLEIAKQVLSLVLILVNRDTEFQGTGRDVHFACAFVDHPLATNYLVSCRQ